MADARRSAKRSRQRLAAEARRDAHCMAMPGIGEALTNPRVILLGLIYFCLVVGLYGIGFWMPQVIKTFGLSNLAVGFLAAIPYFIAAIGMVLAGRHSDAKGERIWHVALPLFLSGAPLPGRPIAGTASARHAGALACRARTFMPRIGTFWSLPTSILTGTGAAAGLALINSIGNCGGFVGPLVVVWLKGATGDFHRGASVPCRSAGPGRRCWRFHFGRVARTGRRRANRSKVEFPRALSRLAQARRHRIGAT